MITIKKIDNHTLVRQATNADRSEMIRLMKLYFDFYGVTHPNDDNIHALLDVLLLSSERGIQFICEYEGKAIGFATLYATFSSLRAQKAMIMNDLFVESTYRGKGLGKALFQHCLAYVKQHGYAYMEWVTASDNGIAQKFYEKQGAERSSWVVYSL